MRRTFSTLDSALEALVKHGGFTIAFRETHDEDGYGYYVTIRVSANDPIEYYGSDDTWSSNLLLAIEEVLYHMCKTCVFHDAHSRCINKEAIERWHCTPWRDPSYGCEHWKENNEHDYRGFSIMTQPDDFYKTFVAKIKRDGFASMTTSARTEEKVIAAAHAIVDNLEESR